MTDATQTSERYDAFFIVTPGDGRGNANAARALIGRAFRKVLGITKWYDGAHFVTYQGSAELTHELGRSYGDMQLAKFSLNVSDEECKAVCAEIVRSAALEGWSSAPFDCYHDEPAGDWR